MRMVWLLDRSLTDMKFAHPGRGGNTAKIGRMVDHAVGLGSRTLTGRLDAP